MIRWLQWIAVVLALCTCGCPPVPTLHSISMKWDDVGAPEYTIYRGPAPNALSLIATTATPTYTDTAVAAGTSYFYGVKSREPDGTESPVSNVVSATVPN